MWKKALNCTYFEVTIVQPQTKEVSYRGVVISAYKNIFLNISHIAQRFSHSNDWLQNIQFGWYRVKEARLGKLGYVTCPSQVLSSFVL